MEEQEKVAEDGLAVQTQAKKRPTCLPHECAQRSANVSEREEGAGDGIRTRDSLLGRQELYH